MKILLLEPYYTGSHSAWAEGYAHHSNHTIEILSLPGRFWKWRMHGGAVTLARQFLDLDFQPDLLLATDMIDVTTFLALTRPHLTDVPVAIYFHENQLTYPWSEHDRDVAQKRDKHYGFINYVSALAADVVLFNSAYHQASFLKALPQLLKHFPDYNELQTVDEISAKSQVLPLGLDLQRLAPYQSATPQPDPSTPPLILWSHRWEYDKGPQTFFKALTMLAERGLEFDIAVLGQSFSRKPEPFLKANAQLADRIVQFGYTDSVAEYAQWLWQADILPVTSKQDFFGAAVVEAIYCDCFPLLPKRLAYPTIIPATYHDDHFYDDFDDLVARLAQAITHIEQIRQVSLQDVVTRYDWQEQAHRYDQRLTDVVNTHAQA